MPRLIAALLLLLVVGVDRGTGAVWSDSGTVPGGPIHTGHVDLRVDGADTLPDLGSLDLPLLAPGQTVATTLTVGNQGDVALSWTASTSGTGPAALLDTVEVRVTDATTTDGSTCGGTAVAGSRTVGPDAAERVCVQVELPAGVPATLAAQEVELAVTFEGGTGGWTDTAAVGGIDVATVSLQAPAVVCHGLLGVDLTMAWEEVPGATEYRVVDGLGSVTQTIAAGGLLEADLGALVGASVEAVYGSGWTSAGATC